ncbi:MAG: 16S rRNA (guanine(966)-N(2))-methyltransferase RsmD [Hyphomicrobiales bacterium]|nr:16S rRNA (guanine(966)-N(2))-methyltransferase RsmD [Hyphomicrobiales bacterium]
MRIVAGKFGGRSLKAPASHAIRPTSDRLRETIFNILAHGHDKAVENARVIDIFAGTGALGLEALSRGARFALFVDDGAQARALIRANVEALGLGGASRIFRRDATKLGQAPAGEIFDIAFLDPPYGKGLAPRALDALCAGGWLRDGALCVIEEAASEEIALPRPLQALERRVYGETQIIVATQANC